MREISIYNLINYIKDNYSGVSNVKDLFLEKEKQFDIFENIFFIEDDFESIIFENKNFIIKINLKNKDNLEMVMLDPFLFEKGIYKSIDKKVLNINFSINHFFSFINNKKSIAFYYKRQILEIINDFGIECESDLINFNENVNLKLEDILFLMRDSYMKSLKIKNSNL
tara:strand:- start:10759 stop:11262 length:504 start_codon:yes stop_codon:yes gene_type:complete